MGRQNEFHGAYAGEVSDGGSTPEYTDEELREQLEEVPTMLLIARAELDPTLEMGTTQSEDAEFTPEDIAIYRQYLGLHSGEGTITTGGPIHACQPEGSMVALCGQAVVWVDPEYEWPLTRYCVDQGDGSVPFVEETCVACAREMKKLQSGVGSTIRRMFRSPTS